MILAVCAVARELDGFAAPGVRVVAVGIGPVEAALGTARALASAPYELLVNVGIGGGFDGRARVGDAAVVESERYVELGREDRGELAGGLTLADTARSDAALVERLRGTVEPLLSFGGGVTSATITTSDARAAELAAAFDPLCESMEGFAVLRAAATAGIPAIELRGISNRVGDRARGGWDFRAGSAAARAALEALLRVVQP
jgi:futalosine hydrolase